MRSKLYVTRVAIASVITAVVASVVGAAIIPGIAAAIPPQVNNYFVVKVVATFAAGQTAPSSDTITGGPGGQTVTANSTGTKGNTTMYETAAQYQSNITFAKLNECSTIIGGNACVTITHGNPNQATPTVYTITGKATNLNLGGGAGAGNATHPECLTSGNALAWVLCPVFNLLADASDWIFTQVVTPFLITSPISTSPSDPIYVAWSTFRMYADIFLVLALLVLVIGEAIGGGLIDAYTVRKALPRLIAAVIFVNLSIYIVAFLVDITNIVGKSIGNVLIEPFKVAKDWSFTPTTGQGVGVFGIGLIGLLATGGSIAAVLTGFFSRKTGVDAEFAKIALQMVFFILIPVFLSILAVFITLIIRKGLILFLILISPVAFALYALPGTERLFKKWWDLLLESLLIYPIVIVIFAVADILSVTILNANGVSQADVTGGNGGSILAIIVAFVLQFLPLLAVPFAFRMAGGTLSRAHEMITNGRNKLTQSGFYGTKKDAAQKRWADQMGTARATMWNSANAKMPARVPFASRYVGSRAARYAQQASIGATNVMKDPRAVAVAHHGDALMAGILGTSDADAYKNLVSHYDKYTDAVQRRDGETDGQFEARRAQRTAAIRGRAEESVRAWKGTGLGYGIGARMAALEMANADGTVFVGNQAKGLSANQQYHEALGAVIGQNSNALGDVVGQAYGAQGSTRRFDLTAGGYGDTLALQKALQNGGRLREGDKLFGETIGPGGRTLTPADFDRAAVEGALATSNTQLGNIRGAGAKNLRDTMGRTLQRAIDTNDMKLAARIVGKYENMRDAGPYTAEAITQIFGDSFTKNPEDYARVLNAVRADPATGIAANPEAKAAYDEVKRGGMSGRLLGGGEGGGPLGV